MANRNQPSGRTVAAARAVALAEVERRWPELAGIEPTMTRRSGIVLEIEHDTLAKAAEFTFTFAGHMHTPDGYILPRIARVTVDADQRVVKATTSK